MPPTDDQHSSSPSASISLNFSSKTLLVEKNGTVEAVETVELVNPEHVLATLSASTAPNLPKNPTNTTLSAGTFTKFSAQGDSLLATTAGWPQISRTKVENGEIATIAVVPLVDISPDSMEAHMTLYPPLPGSAPLQLDALVTLVQQCGVRYGLNREILQNCLEQSRKEQTIIHSILIAKGSLPIAGEDAHLRFEVDIGSIPGKLMGNGSIDFHERRMFFSVRKNQLIAVKVPATSGSPGSNVRGQILPQQQGQNITVATVDNAIFDEGTGEVRATKPGILTIVGNTIKVCSKLTISGDINFKTGNIDANDAVEIGGSVMPGFLVKSHGDLRIGGEITSAQVVSQGNIYVGGRVSGKQTTVRASGDIDLPFVEQSSISADGSIIIHKTVYYSHIIAGGNIHCEETCRILGGIAIAGGSVSVGHIGSDTADPAIVAAGTDGKQFLRYDKLRQEISEKEDELEHCLQLHGHDSQLPFHLTMTEELEEMNEELRKINLASDKKAATPEELSARLRSHTITVHGVVFPETILRIGNVTFLVDRRMASVIFALSEDLTEIVSHPLITR